MNRLQKFFSLKDHAYYCKDIARLSAQDWAKVVELLEDNAELDNDAFTIKVTRLWSDGIGRPKNHGTLCDLLLASRDMP